jgi:uncharacterized protein YjiS (DUF1127 family)
MAHRSDIAANANSALAASAPALAASAWSPRSIATTPVSTQALAASAWVFTASRDLLRALLTWYVRERERRALAALDARMLHDIGLTRADVQVEVEKRPWER